MCPVSKNVGWNTTKPYVTPEYLLHKGGTLSIKENQHANEVHLVMDTP